MKAKDRLKEEIGLEKLLLTLLVAILSSLSSWTWSNKIILPHAIVGMLYFLCLVAAIAAVIFSSKLNSK
jgi:hypothetical protein